MMLLRIVTTYHMVCSVCCATAGSVRHPRKPSSTRSKTRPAMATMRTPRAHPAPRAQSVPLQRAIDKVDDAHGRVALICDERVWSAIGAQRAGDRGRPRKHGGRCYAVLQARRAVARQCLDAALRPPVAQRDLDAPNGVVRSIGNDEGAAARREPQAARCVELARVVVLTVRVLSARHARARKRARLACGDIDCADAVEASVRNEHRAVVV
mmetsp:Transcript_26244/g.67829  ORF Transcript_26244/g.67829 Transcript_26244/m.67829 type:complete len:211 (-) Transcript_26244:110-742(-)